MSYPQLTTMKLLELVELARKYELIPEVRECQNHIEVDYDDGATVVLDPKQSIIYLRSVIQANIQRQLVKQECLKRTSAPIHSLVSQRLDRSSKPEL